MRKYNFMGGSHRLFLFAILGAMQRFSKIEQPLWRRRDFHCEK